MPKTISRFPAKRAGGKILNCDISKPQKNRSKLCNLFFGYENMKKNADGQILIREFNRNSHLECRLQIQINIQVQIN